MQNLSKMLKVTIINIIFIALLSGCSENPPVIDQAFYQINRFKEINSASIYDLLSLFLFVTDSDGIEDIKSIYLINDVEELFWKLTSDNWVIKENHETTWIGSNRITMHDKSSFPSGSYRAVVIDSAGEREEFQFILKNSSYKPEKNEFPSLIIKNKQAEIDRNSDVLWLYNNEGDLLSEKYFKHGNTKVTLTDDVSNIFVYRYNRLKGVGLISGPYINK